MINRVPAHVRSAALPAAIEAATILSPTLAKWPRTKKVVQLLAAIQTGHKLYSSMRERFERPSEDWRVTVKSNDSLYDYALELLADQSEQNWQVVEAELDYDYDREADTERPSITAKPLQRVERNLVLGGHRVFAYIDHVPVAPPSGPQISLGGSIRSVSTRLSNPEVVFVASEEAGQKAVLDALREKTAQSQESSRASKRKPTLKVSTPYGDWTRKGSVPARPIESIAVTHDQVREVAEDIRVFRSLEAEYVRRGVPHHRGYLLYGPPGTGKTSAVKALAHELGSDLYAVNLGSLSEDSYLQGLVSNVPAGAILLLEDIDAFGATRQRTEGAEGAKTGRNAGVSLTGLLNALDGVETPEGLVTIMTTNHREFLDDALIRPGRVDKHVFFGYPDDATVRRHFEFFYDRPPSVPLYAAGRSGAELNEVFVAHMTHPEGAEQLLSSRVRAVAA